MQFAQQLNGILAHLGCTAKELGEVCGLSAASISRLRSGERTPDPAELERLVDGLVLLAEAHGDGGLTKEAAAEAFAACADLKHVHAETLQTNFNRLLTVLPLSVAELSRALNYDPSYLSRIRNGQRVPADPEGFAGDAARFFARRFEGPAERAALAELTGCPAETMQDEQACAEALAAWLTGETVTVSEKRPMEAFLRALDAFDLNEYIHAIHFDELKIPTAPFSLPTSKRYYGVEEMKKGELDFLRATVLSRSTEPVFFYSDMPMEDMAADLDFSKKYMFGIALLLKKGLQLNIVHDLNRPFEELMLGLESHIPLYMTGQIAPYFFGGVQNEVFCHFLKVSGAAALSGECVAGHHDRGMYTLTKNREGIAYERVRADDLLKRARPLMDIYRADRQMQLKDFLAADQKTTGTRRFLLAALPIATAAEAFLRAFLAARAVPEAERQAILVFAAAERVRLEAILAQNDVCMEVPDLTPDDLQKRPVSLALAGMFLERDYPYTADEYEAHLAETKAFAAAHPRLTLKQVSQKAFRNIDIEIHAGAWAMISKNKVPVIHFVIRHPRLRQALEEMVLPVVESEG